MKNAKQLLLRVPEYYLIVLVTLAGYNPPFDVNIISAVLAVILIAQLIFKTRLSGLIIAGVFLLINLYLLGALFSEFNEFTEFNTKAQQLLFGGLSLWCLNMFFAMVMIYKYARFDSPSNSQKGIKRQNV